MTRRQVISGVYCIENKVNGKKYFGRAIDIYHRWKNHVHSLDYKTHRNKHLERSWWEYGKENFEFYIIEECDYERSVYLEIELISKFNSNNLNFGYNKTPGGEGFLGYYPTDEVRKKLREQRLHKKVHSSSKSEYVGVYWNEEYESWKCTTTVDGKEMYFGAFKSEIECAQMFDMICVYYYRDSQKDLNFPENYEYYLDEIEDGFTLPSLSHPNKKFKHTSEHIDVYPKGGKWITRITISGKNRHIGTFVSETLAAQNHDLFELEYNDFSSERINFPELIPIYKDILMFGSIPIQEEISFS